MPRVLITGAERGLGFALARAFTDGGWSVAALCRETTPGIEALAPEFLFDGIDVSNAAHVRRAAAEMGDAALDALINNAGIMVEDDIDGIDIAAVRRQFEVNALGPLNVVLAFRGRLKRGAKVVQITSLLGSIGDNESGGDYGYRMSKAAQNMLTANLAHDLGRDGIVAVAVHPGIVATDMTGGRGTPAGEVAREVLAMMGALGPADAGRFLDRHGEPLPW
jgi:NAD(P)-dependent dehydrogenase (short-subunit alcohol dehydrogenase family)